MLEEFKNISQEKDGYRRLFEDDKLELYIWYDKKGGEIVGFQLCYNQMEDEHILTWVKGKGYSHNKLDSGEDRPGRYKQSPILIQDGIFNKTLIAKEFKNASSSIDKNLSQFIYSKILEYGTKQ